MRIMVTGGAGYIGRYVIRALHEAGCAPLSFDVKRPHEDCDFIIGDARSQELGAVLRSMRVSGVVHLAAHSSVAESVADPGRYAENVAACRNLAAAAGGLPVALASSAAVYGENEGGAPLGEWDRLAPVNPYGWSKLASEAALPNAMALRLFNVAGGVGDQGDHILPRAVQAHRRGHALRVNGAGYAVRDYVHVEDVARAFVGAVLALAAGTRGAPLNISTGVGHTVRQVAEAVGAHGGRELPTVCGADRPGDVHRLVGDRGRALLALGWEPHHDFEDIVASALAGTDETQAA